MRPILAPERVLMITDRAEFIRSHTVLKPVPHAPEIKLYVADEITELWDFHNSHPL